MSKVTISDFILAVSDLIEAQSKELQKEWNEFLNTQRKKTFNTASLIGLLFLSLVILAASAGFFIWGLSELLLNIMPLYAVMFIDSAILFILFLLILLYIKKKNG